MTVSTIDEFRMRVGKTPAAQDRKREMQAQVHEGVRAQAITGHADWDHFLAGIQGRIKMHQEAAAVEHARLCDPAVVNQDEIMKSKVRVACFNMAIAVLEEVQLLPKRLIEAGQDAAAKLRAIEPPEPPE